MDMRQPIALIPGLAFRAIAKDMMPSSSLIFAVCTPRRGDRGSARTVPTKSRRPDNSEGGSTPHSTSIFSIFLGGEENTL